MECLGGSTSCLGLSVYKTRMVTIIFITPSELSTNLGSMPFDSLLSRILARLGTPGLTHVEIIYYKDVYVSITFIIFFHGFLENVNTCFYLFIALMVS